jgi:murein DD-endopeptidase MepM/ murein hydrolase activator NlpD
MKFRYTILYLLLFMALSLGFAQTAAASHTVKRGETLYSIAQTYGVDADELMRANRITNPRGLQVGKQLAIPPKSPTAATEHRAKRGETLFGIAREYGVTVQMIKDANKLSESYILKEGDLLRIPRKSETVASGISSVVARPADAPRWPVAARDVEYRGGKLGGVILIGEKSEMVRSLSTGSVISAGPYHGFGRVVVVQASGGYTYVYGNCESLTVKVGDTVHPGTELGRLSAEAGTEQPRLFFMVFRNNTPVDPAKAPRL